jgi:RNA recognition motif-containing protein
LTKIFVGSLPYTTTSDELKAMFAAFGEVATASVVMDKFTGRSRGFGFVEMPNDEEAKAAIEKLNGSDLDGRNLAVSVARPREERPSNDFRPRNNFRDDRNGGDRNFDRNR